MEAVTAILTIWKRDRIEEQLEALINQSIPPSEIWVYHCCDFISSKASLVKKYKTAKYCHLSQDLGYFGRFSIGLHVRNPFLFVLDDDVIPSENWIEYSLDLITRYNAIISSSGRRLGDDFRPEDTSSLANVKNLFIGDGSQSKYRNFCPQDTFVAFGCNSWFMRTAWLQYFWAIRPYSMETGEDIHLSAACATLGSIPTLVPMQDGKETCGNLCKYYGFDDVASWKQDNFLNRREEIIRYFVELQGWRPESVIAHQP